MLVAALLLLFANVAYSSYRATCLASCDLRVGYLVPTRELLFCGKDPNVDLAFNSFPPFFYSVIAPFALIPDALASVFWSALQLGCFFFVAALTWELLRRAWGGVPSALAPLLAPLPLLLNNLHLGQSNLLPLALIAAGMLLARSGKDLSAGVAMAAASAFKVTPALMIIYLGLFRLRPRLLAGAVLGLALFMGVLPSVVFGPAKGFRWVVGWERAVAMPFVLGQSLKTTTVSWRHTNQSLEAFMQRHFTPFGAARYGGAHRRLDCPWLDERGAHRVANAARAAIMLALVGVAIRGRRRPRDMAPLELALIPMAWLFIAPVAWTSHYIAAMPAYLVAARLLQLLPKASRWRTALAGGLATPLGLLALAAAPATESYSPVFLGHFVLWGVLMSFALAGRFDLLGSSQDSRSLTDIQPVLGHVLEHLARHQGRDVLASRELFAHVGRADLGERRPGRFRRGKSRAGHDDDLGELLDPSEVLPLRPLGQDVAADDQREAVLRVSVEQVLERLDGAPQAGRLGLGAVHLDETAEPRGGALAHPDPVLERCQPLGERVPMDREEPDAIDGARGEHVVGIHQVADVRRVE